MEITLGITLGIAMEIGDESRRPQDAIKPQSR
jgi:hypothetical protein